MESTPERDGANQSRNLHILVVDDNQDSAFSTAMLLRLYGHEVTVAHDGPTALQMVDGNIPDVVLLDLAMPKMDGWKVAEVLRQRQTPKRPLIIAISGYGDDAARQQSAEVGIDLHWHKPVDFEALLPLLQNHPVLTMPSAPRKTLPQYGTRPMQAGSLRALSDRGRVKHLAQKVVTIQGEGERCRGAVEEYLVRSEVVLKRSYQHLYDSQAHCRSVASWLDRVLAIKRQSRCS
jgi:CheY-like chemotaxis protein